MKILFLIPLLLLIPLSSFATNGFVFTPQYPSKFIVDNAMNTALNVYNSRLDLQNAFPEVRQGYYTNLIVWIYSEQPSDSSFNILQQYNNIWSFFISNKQYIPNQGYQYPQPVKISGQSFTTGHEYEWFYSQGEEGKFRCTSYSGFGNYTIDSIEGMISFAKIDQPKNNFDQSMTHVFVSNSYFQSAGGSTTDSVCMKNGVTPITAWGTLGLGNDTKAEVLGSFNLKLGQGINSTDVYYSVHPNVLVPPHYYLTFMTDEGSQYAGNLTNTWTDLEPQLTVNVH